MTMATESSLPLPPPPPRRQGATLRGAPFPPPPVNIHSMNFVRTVRRNSMAGSMSGKTSGRNDSSASHKTSGKSPRGRGSSATSPPRGWGEKRLRPPAAPREEDKKYSPPPPRRNKTVSFATGIEYAERITSLSVSANNGATNVSISALAGPAKTLYADPAKEAALERVPAESAPDGPIPSRRPSPPTVKDTRPQTQEAVARRVTFDTPAPRPPPPSRRPEDGRLRGGRTPVVVAAATSPSYRVPPPMSPGVQAIVVRELSKAVEAQLAQRMAAGRKKASTNEDTACYLRSLSYPPRALVATKSSRDDSGLSNRLPSRCYGSSPDVQAVVVREISKALGGALTQSTAACMKKVSTNADAARSLSLACPPGALLVAPPPSRVGRGPSNSSLTCTNCGSDGTRATPPLSLRLPSLNDAGSKKTSFPRDDQATYLPRNIIPPPPSRGRGRSRSQGPPPPPRTSTNANAACSLSPSCPPGALREAPSSLRGGRGPPTSRNGGSNGTGATAPSSLRLSSLNDAGSKKTTFPRDDRATHLPQTITRPPSSRGRARSRSQGPPSPPRRKRVSANVDASSFLSLSCSSGVLLAPSSREGGDGDPCASPLTCRNDGSNGTGATASSSLRLPSLNDAGSKKTLFPRNVRATHLPQTITRPPSSRGRARSRSQGPPPPPRRKKVSFADAACSLSLSCPAGDLLAPSLHEGGGDSPLSSPPTHSNGSSNGTEAMSISSLRLPSLKDASSNKKSFSADDLATYLPQAYTLPPSSRGRVRSRSQGS